MSNEAQSAADAAAIAEFRQSTAPLSQVREDLNLTPGQYDFACTKLDILIAHGEKDEGQVYVQGEFVVLAPASIASLKVGNTHKQRFYIGTKEDKLAQKPETRLNSFGFGKMKSIARVCQLPTNDQPVATLVDGLVGKQFSARIDKNKNGYVEFGRTFSPIGVVPAKLDTEAASAAPVAGAEAANGAAAAATFSA